MQRKHIISLCILLCALAVLVAFRPSADETVALTGSASAGLILLDGQSGGYYVLAVIDQSRADRAGIEAGDTLLTLNSQPPPISPRWTLSSPPSSSPASSPSSAKEKHLTSISPPHNGCFSSRIWL